MKPTLIAMVGLPRSGKSTIVEALRIKTGAPVVRRDAIRLAVHGQRYEPAAEPLIKTFDIYMIRSLFLAGHPVVIADETNYSQAARDHMRDPSWETVFYHVGTGASTCCLRAEQTNQRDLIPVITEMANRWEPFKSSDDVFVDWTANGTLVTKKYDGMRFNSTEEYVFDDGPGKNGAL